jgi:hypothetical protein
MFWTLVATVVCGLGAAGIALMLRSLTRQRLPKWLIPVFAGAGMMAYLVQGEYTWYDFKQTQLPSEAVVVNTESQAVIWRPWSFAFPYVTAFSTVDINSVQRNANDDNVVLFVLYRFEQTLTDSVSHRVHLLNCANRELVPLASDGRPSLDNMKILTPDDRLLITVCR